MSPDEKELDERLLAAVDLVGRTGALSFGLRYQDDEEPTVWMALAQYERPGNPIPWAVGASFDPLAAVFALVDQLIDGAMCVHCGQPTAVAHDLNPVLAEHLLCWYQYDPELKTYRRSCEGETDALQDTDPTNP